MASQPMSARDSRRPLRAAGQGALTPRASLKNPLLTRDDVGRAKPTTYDVPSSEFAFGRPTIPCGQELEGAREVTMIWASHTPSQVSRRPELSYPEFYKKMVKEKVTTAGGVRTKALQAMKDMEGGPAGDEAPYMGQSRDLLPSDVVPEFAYGRKARPSTPIREVINNRFADSGKGRPYEDALRARAENEGAVYKIPFTKASRGHSVGSKAAHGSARGGESSQELFKMNKFKNVSSKIDHKQTNRFKDDVHDEGHEAFDEA